MTGVTHVAVGTMSAVLLTQPQSMKACLASLIGGALGGIICDIDLGSAANPTDIIRARRIAGAIVLACLGMDMLCGWGLWCTIQRATPWKLAAGLIGLVLLWFWGCCQPHRGGTHSLLALVLFGGCIGLICGMLRVPFVIGMVSHLVLDLFNRRPMQLLYPFRGRWCIGLGRADGRPDRWLRMIGLWGTVLGVGICIGRCGGIRLF